MIRDQPTLSARIAERVGSGGHVYTTCNPVTGEIMAVRPALESKAVEDRLQRAHEAFGEWRGLAPSVKADFFRRIADAFEANSEAIGRQISLEMGKILPHAVAEVTIAADIFRYYADRRVELLADEPITLQNGLLATIRREPIGVILGIEPFNAPIYQSMRVAAPCLMLGNTVLVKPSEITAASTLMIDKLFEQAGFPSGCYQTILASPSQIEELIADPRVRGISLTGSDRAGSAIGELAGRAIKPVILELGGSDAFIVLDDADVDAAAATAATCRLIIGGQACALPKRIIVTDGCEDSFISRFRSHFCDQRIGDPLEDGITLGPMSSERAAALLQEQYEDAVAKGATVIAAGGRIEGPGFFFKPAILADLTPEMRLYHEEAFGPLALIFRVRDADAAVEVANDTKYGLGGSVFSTDLDEAQRVASALDTGSVGINSFVGAPIEIPFGGTKASGVGRELGQTGMDCFANIKTYVTPAPANGVNPQHQAGGV